MEEPVGDLRASAGEFVADPEPAPEAEPVPVFGEQLLSQFETHVARLTSRSKSRRLAVQLRSTVLDREEREQASELDMLGKRQPQDEFQGDVNFRTLHALLKMVDERGFERCAACCPVQCALLTHFCV